MATQTSWSRCLATKWGILRQTRQVYNLALVNAKDLELGETSGAQEPWEIHEKSLAAWDLFIGASCKNPGFLRCFPSGHTQLAILWEAVAHSQLAFVDRDSFTLATVSFRNQSIHLCFALQHSFRTVAVLLLISLWNFYTHPQHSWEDGRLYRLHIFMVPSTYFLRQNMHHRSISCSISYWWKKSCWYGAYPIFLQGFFTLSISTGV